jgi:hypothetical protein
MNPVIKELWNDYRKVVKDHGYGIESKQVLIKIYSLAPKE